ncbi:MAG: VWA domain-containing protein, partial [Thermoanaerobaculia bacterium]|nr:VWA domain-containing protein [Thermoanaerobaculia bacterium]
IPRCEETPFLRAVAHTTDGRLAESVYMIDGTADSLSVSLVEIYAMVTDRTGRPVAGLEPAMFELHLGQRSLPIERFTEGDAVPLSLALVIDSSDSMFESMERAKGAAQQFLSQVLDVDDEVLLVDFDHRPRLLAGPTRQVDQLVERFGAIEPDGASAVYDGIAFALLQLRQAANRRALVVLTDGQDSGSRLTARECARLARRSGVPIFVLRHSSRPVSRLSHHVLALDELADSTGGAVYPILSEDDVDAAYEAIERQLRGQYLIAFEVEDALSPDDLATLAVRLGDQRLRVRTILGGQVRLTD